VTTETLLRAILKDPDGTVLAKLEVLSQSSNIYVAALLHIVCVLYPLSFPFEFTSSFKLAGCGTTNPHIHNSPAAVLATDDVGKPEELASLG
jgi:hypothetical protein